MKLITFLLILSALFLGCEEKVTQQSPKAEPKAVTVQTIEKKNQAIWVDYSGKTEAYQSVDLVPRVTGELQQVLFKDGDKVKKGQILFEIDKSKYNAVLAQRIATMKKNQASLALAKTNVKRYTPLVQKALAPKEKLDELIATQQQLEATVVADLASVKQAQLDVEYCTIKAPIDGRIGKSLIDIGNIVNSSSVLANIVQSNFLKVNFNPSSQDVLMIEKFSKNQELPVKIIPEKSANIDVTLDGIIDFIDNVTNDTTGTIAMRAKIDNQKQLVYPGTFVEIKLFITDQIPIITIHPNNIFQNQLGAYVFIVDKDNKVQTQQISIRYSNKEYAIIEKGLKKGDKVIISATNRLQRGELVKVTSPVSK